MESSNNKGFEGESTLYFNDYALARRALEDLDATEIILRRLYPRIYAVVQSFVGRTQNLDDIAQLAAMEVVKCLDSYRGRGSLEAWAAKIAYRKAVRVLDRGAKKKMARLPFTDDELEDNVTLDPEKTMTREQLFDSFISKLNSIPVKRRVPLLLHMMYGYTVSEVSELTDTTINTVKDRLKTASRELHAILERNPRLVAAMLEEMQ